MRVSKRGEYALRSLINLGIARELGRPMLQIRQLAEKEKYPGQIPRSHPARDEPRRLFGKQTRQGGGISSRSR